MSNRDLLIQLYPRLYHMAHEGAWPSIERHGLLSTTALLDLFEVSGGRREQLESGRRSRSEEITHPVHGSALLRDQIPLNEKKLEKALEDDLTVRDWCRILNRRVFFWASEKRLAVLQSAKQYKENRQTIVVVDTEQLVKRHEARIFLSHMNSGATQPMAFPRGYRTFLRTEDYPLAERKVRRGKSSAVVEVTVDYSIPDLCEFVMDVYEVGGRKPLRRLI